MEMCSKAIGEHDMTSLQDISVVAMAENLKERLKAGIIYVSNVHLECKRSIIILICICHNVTYQHKMVLLWSLQLSYFIIFYFTRVLDISSSLPIFIGKIFLKLLQSAIG